MTVDRQELQRGQYLAVDVSEFRNGTYVISAKTKQGAAYNYRKDLKLL